MMDPEDHESITLETESRMYFAERSLGRAWLVIFALILFVALSFCLMFWGVTECPECLKLDAHHESSTADR